MQTATSSNGEMEQGGILSLPVRNVQDLAAAPPTVDGLQRYERPEINDLPVLSDSLSGEIPVIDFSSLLDPQLWEEEAKRLHHACEEWGFFQVLSNGKYKSIEHRVVIDPKKERLSIATFHNAMNLMVVGPLPEIVKGCEENYQTMSHKDFMKIFYSNKLNGKNLIDYVKLKK